MNLEDLATLKITTNKFGKEKVLEGKVTNGKYYYYDCRQLRYFPIAKKYILDVEEI